MAGNNALPAYFHSMRKRCIPNPAQLRLTFPPALTPELVTCWRHLKLRFPDPVVFVGDSGHYICLDNDAKTIAQLTNMPFHPSSIACLMIAIDRADTWFQPITAAGMSILICDPPDDPSRFVFT